MAETSRRSSCFVSLTPEEERLKIRDISLSSESQSREGDTFYLITQRRPMSIDNTDLICDTTCEDSSFPELHDKYGGGPTLARKVISSGLSHTELAVEVYPLRLRLLLMPKGDRSTVRIGKKESIGELYRRACEVFYLNIEQVRIWDYYGQRKHALMNDVDKTLDDANIQMDQDSYENATFYSNKVKPELVEFIAVMEGKFYDRILVEVLNNASSIADGGCTSVQENGSTVQELTSFLLEPTKSSLSIAGGLSASKGASRSCSSEISQSQNISSPVRELDNANGTSGVTTRGSPAGLSGLVNLGNTCFMNSAIQCLVHTPELAKYFREDYHREINWQNPLGMVGELALAFGELLRKLWAPGRTPIAPRAFKAKLARFAPQFSGYNQHDSQELLAFLLDGLHEDLNRVKHKPYVKSRDADGQPDEEVADEYWANHTARNDSIIVDVCQILVEMHNIKLPQVSSVLEVEGQYKSTLVCPVCNKVSVTFDPFMYLSLPLQSTVTRSITVTIFSSDGSASPDVCTVTIPKPGRCRDLLQALTSASSLKPNEKLLLAEIRNHLILRFFEDPFISLSSVKDDDRLVAYKISNLTGETLLLQLIHRSEEEETNNSKGTRGWKPYGTPLVLPIPCSDVIKRGDIQSMVQKMLSPLIRTGFSSKSGALWNGSSAVAQPTDIKGEIRSDSDVIRSEPEDRMSSETYAVDKLPLQLVDENNACIDLTVEEEKAIDFASSSTPLIGRKGFAPDVKSGGKQARSLIYGGYLKC
ncbi:Ubiquitin carboxyl-terminal hydrolase 5-like protein [Drosera capensis]